MLRVLRFRKLLCAALVGATFALAIPVAAFADHWHRPGFGVWLPFPPPPPFFFWGPRVHRHDQYCDHRYDRYDRDERWDRYDRYERRHDDRHERGNRHDDRHERW